MRYGLSKVDKSLSSQAADKRESGFQRMGETCDASIQAHNQELVARTGDLMELAVVVLTEQRDNALRLLATANERFEEQQSHLVAEQDKFITFLMSEHEQKLAELQDAVEDARAQLLQRSALAPLPVAELAPGEHDGALISQVKALKQALEAATSEIEETRQDASRLQEERDEAIRAIDDARIELMTDVEAARDECFQLETRLDDANRLLEDARDQVRDEASRFNEDIGELRRDLDEKNEEIRRLRARLATHVAETKTSHPPPPAVSQELERARREPQQLRQQVIEAKRELARRSHESEGYKGSREAPVRPAGGLRTQPLPRPVAAPETRRFDPKVPTRSVTPLGFVGPTPKRD